MSDKKTGRISHINKQAATLVLASTLALNLGAYAQPGQARPDLEGMVKSNSHVVQELTQNKVADVESQPLSFYVIGDTAEEKNLTYKRLLAEMKKPEQGKPKPEFVVHLGDGVFHGRPNEFRLLLEAEKDFPYSIIHLPGNHDLRHEGRKLFNEMFGDSDFFFDYKGARLIFMTNVDLKKRHNASKDYGFTDKKLGWLEQALAGSGKRKKILFSHVPPKMPFEKLTPDLTDLFVSSLLNEDKFLELLDKYDVNMAVFGHRHVYTAIDYKGTILVISGGGGQGNRLESNPRTYFSTKKNHFLMVGIDSLMGLQGSIRYAKPSGREMLPFYQPPEGGLYVSPLPSGDVIPAENSTEKTKAWIAKSGKGYR